MSNLLNFPILRPSLLLDFANSKQVDPRITFTRASTATYYDGKTAAKAEENLLLRSQEFEDAVWTKSDSFSLGDQVVAPNGTLTSDKLVENSTTNYHFISEYFSSSGGVFTYSVYAKKLERSRIAVRETTTTGNGAIFDLDAGSVFSNLGGGVGSISSVGNGWYRCVVIATETSGTRGFGVYIGPSTATTLAAFSYLGDNTSGAFLWGAQLEQRSSVTAYTPTTTQPITNYIPVLLTAAAGVPRIDHDPVTGECRGLLIEEARTNLLTYSEQFDNAAWTKTGATVTANAIAAPNGALEADKLVEDTSNGPHRLRFGGTGLANNASRCLSVFVKADVRNVIYLTINAFGGNYIIGTFNLVTGEVSSAAFGNGVVTFAHAYNVGGGYWRIWLAGTPDTTSATTSLDYYIALGNGATGSYTGDGTSGLYIWGAQVEAGTFPTSYIPTTSAAATRAAAAPSMSGTNFSEWYRQGEGAFVVFARRDSLSTGRLITLSDGTASNQIRINVVVSSTSLRADLEVVTGGVSQVSTTTTPVFAVGSMVAIAFAYKADDFAISVNGTTVVTDTSGTVPTVDRVHIGTDHAVANHYNGTVARIAYYPKRLSNAELQALTA